MADPKPRARVRQVGRLWITPYLPIPVSCIRCVVLGSRPQAVRLMINGAEPRFVRIERRKGS